MARGFPVIQENWQGKLTLPQLFIWLDPSGATQSVPKDHLRMAPNTVLFYCSPLRKQLKSALNCICTSQAFYPITYYCVINILMSLKYSCIINICRGKIWSKKGDLRNPTINSSHLRGLPIQNFKKPQLLQKEEIWIFDQNFRKTYVFE